MLICRKELNIGDYVKVKYLYGNYQNETIKGKIIKLWSEQNRQAQIENGYCFHEEDEIIEHKGK